MARSQTAAPQFTRIDYAIKKYAGYLPVTNELLADSDAAIANTIMQWLADESVATENAQILAKVKTVSATHLQTLRAFKNAVNVTCKLQRHCIHLHQRRRSQLP